MAYEANLELLPGVVAAADYSAATNQYKLVKLTSAGVVTVCSAVTDQAIGVLLNRPASGEAADVAIRGVCKVRASTSVSVGARIASDADGDGVTSSTAGHFAIGIAITAAGATGDYFSCIISSPAQVIA